MLSEFCGLFGCARKGVFGAVKPPIAYGKFGALCPTAVFLRLPVKKVRRLRDLGLVRLFGGLTRPEDLAEDWRQHAHRLETTQLATSLAGSRVAGGRPRGSHESRATPARVRPLACSFESWSAAQGAKGAVRP